MEEGVCAFGECSALTQRTPAVHPSRVLSEGASEGLLASPTPTVATDWLNPEPPPVGPCVGCGLDLAIVVPWQGSLREGLLAHWGACLLNRFSFLSKLCASNLNICELASSQIRPTVAFHQ